MAASLAEIFNDPNYTNANAATKKAIFDKFSAQDPNYTNANAATQQAIRVKFGVAQTPSRGAFVESVERISPFRALGMSEEAERGLAGGGARGLYSATGIPRLMGADLPSGKEFDAYMRAKFGIDPTSGSYQTGKFASETGLGMGAVGGFAKLMSLIPGVRALAPVVSSGGFEAGTLSGFGSLVARPVGGAVAGAIGAGVADPEDAAAGGVIGAVAGPAFRLGVGGFRAVKNMFADPQIAAENALLRNIGDESVNALRASQGMPTTPGYTPSVSERLVEGGAGSLAIARLQDTVARLSPDALKTKAEAIQRNMDALYGQLSRIDAQIAQAVPADAVRLNEIRNALQRQLGDQERQLNEAATALRAQFRERGAAYPEGGTPGEIIQARAEALRDQTRRGVVQPAYRAAFDAAGNAPIDVTPIAAAARAALGRPLAEFAPESMPAVARVLARLEPTPIVETRIGPRGRPQRVTVGEAPPTMTLEDLDALRKAINSDITSASRSQAGLVPAQQPDLYALHRQIDQVIADSPTLSAEAKRLYGDALNIYRTRYATAFKSPTTGRLLKDTTFDRTQVMDTSAVDAYLSKQTTTEEFLRTFGQDPQARAAFVEGIRDRFRDAVVDTVTDRIRPDQASAFLAKYADQFQVLENAGVPIRQQLQQVQANAQRITQGLDEIGTLRTAYGQETTQDIVQSLLNSPRLMSDALTRLSPAGQEAVQSSIVRRVTNMLSGETPDVGGAVKFLADKHSASIKLALGKDGFADLERLVERTGQVRRVAADLQKSLPDIRVQPKVAQLTGSFTREELTDLSVVAADISRFRKAEGLASIASEAANPRGQAIVSAGREAEGGVFPQNALNFTANLALRISKALEGKLNDKAANELAVLLYRNPDQVMDALQRAAARKERRTMFSQSAGRSIGVIVPQTVAPVVDFERD